MVTGTVKYFSAESECFRPGRWGGGLGGQNPSRNPEIELVFKINTRFKKCKLNYKQHTQQRIQHILHHCA